MKRVFIVAVLLIVALLAGPTSAVPQGTTAADVSSIVHRLDAVAAIIGNANARLDAINTAIGTAVPPDDKPAIEDTLDQVVVQLNEAERIVILIQDKIR